MEIGKMLKVSIVPIVLLVIVGVLQKFIGLLPVIGGLTSCVLFPLGLLVIAAVLCWSGYGAGRAGMGIAGGAVVGTIVGLLSSLISVAISFILDLLGIGVGVATNNFNPVVAMFGVGFGIVAYLLGVIGWTVTGAICGAIGAVVGEPKANK